MPLRTYVRLSLNQQNSPLLKLLHGIELILFDTKCPGETDLYPLLSASETQIAMRYSKLVRHLQQKALWPYIANAQTAGYLIIVECKNVVEYISSHLALSRTVV